MSQDVVDMICNMDLGELGTQLALQCAPLIANLKISNLFVTDPAYVRAIRKVLDGTDISFYVLTASEDKATLLLYDKNSLSEHLCKKRERNFLKLCGYADERGLTSSLWTLRRHYIEYLAGKACFPHEMGIFLGYPLEDVVGFMTNDGKKFLYSGYWKVYKDVKKKKELFDLYESAKETLVRLVAGGANITEILETYANKNRSHTGKELELCM